VHGSQSHYRDITDCSCWPLFGTMSGNCHKKEFAIKKATQLGYIFCQGFVCISAWFIDRSEMRQARRGGDFSE